MATAFGRKANGQLNDSYALRVLVSKFVKQYLDEVRLYDIQLLLKALCNEGNSQAILKTYRGSLKKLFCWVEESELARIRNPVTKNALIPETLGLVRERFLFWHWRNGCLCYRYFRLGDHGPNNPESL